MNDFDAGWLGGRRIDLEICESTNDEAARLARAGASHGTVVTATAQRAGRGRDGRPWASPPGMGLYLSAIVRPPLSLALVPPMTLAIGIGVCDTARELGVPAHLKYPNDALVGHRKLAGVLVEAQSQGSRLEAVIVGIGMNIGGPLPESVRDIATTLERERADRAYATTDVAAPRIQDNVRTPLPHGVTASLPDGVVASLPHGVVASLPHGVVAPPPHGIVAPLPHAVVAPLTHERVVKTLLSHVERWIDRYVACGLPAIIPMWEARMERGLVVRAGTIVGVAVGLGDDGALAVRDAGGAVHFVRSGDVETIGRVPTSGDVETIGRDARCDIDAIGRALSGDIERDARGDARAAREAAGGADREAASERDRDSAPIAYETESVSAPC